MKVSLADRLGNAKKVRVGFSFFHLLTGPIYSLIHLKIFTFLFECVCILYFLPVPGMGRVVNYVNKLTFIPDKFLVYIEKVLMLFRLDRGNYYYVFGILIYLSIHIYISKVIRNKHCKRLMKRKQLLPFEEIDARKLISYRIVKYDVLLADAFDIRQSNTYKSAEENWYENNQNRLKKAPSFSNRYTMPLNSEERYKTRFEQIENSYNLGLISKNEYERKIKLLKREKNS